MKKSLSILFPSLLMASLSQAAIYSSNFDSLNYGQDLAGQDGWTISGATNSGGPSLVTDSPFPSPISGGQGAAFGFQEITGTSVYLSHSYGEPLVGTPYGYAQFLTAVTIQDSNPLYPKRDVFGFTFRGTGNEDIFTIRFSPTAQVGNPSLNTRVDNVSWSSDFAVSPGAIGTLTEGQWTTIDLKFEPLGANSVKFTLKTAGIELDSGTLTGAGLGSATISTFGAIWEPLDSLDVGANQMYFDDISMVPEPSAALLGLLGATFAFSRRRRA